MSISMSMSGDSPQPARAPLRTCPPGRPRGDAPSKSRRRVTRRGNATPADMPARSPPRPAASTTHSQDPDRPTPPRTCHLIQRPPRAALDGCFSTADPRSPADVRPAVLSACSLPRQTTPADLHLGRANNGDAPPAGRPEEGRAATQRDPPRPAGAPPTSRGHTRTCSARPPTPRPLQTGGRSLWTCPPATRGLTTRVVRKDGPPRRAGPGSRWRR